MSLTCRRVYRPVCVIMCMCERVCNHPWPTVAVGEQAPARTNAINLPLIKITRTLLRASRTRLLQRMHKISILYVRACACVQHVEWSGSFGVCVVYIPWGRCMPVSGHILLSLSLDGNQLQWNQDSAINSDQREWFRKLSLALYNWSSPKLSYHVYNENMTPQESGCLIHNQLIQTSIQNCPFIKKTSWMNKWIYI